MLAKPVKVTHNGHIAMLISEQEHIVLFVSWIVSYCPLVALVDPFLVLQSLFMGSYKVYLWLGVVSFIIVAVSRSVSRILSGLILPRRSTGSCRFLVFLEKHLCVFVVESVNFFRTQDHLPEKILAFFQFACTKVK